MNSLNSKPLLYNMLQLPPSKLITVFNFSSTFGSRRFSFLHTKLLNCEPNDKFMEILWLLLSSVPCLAGRSAGGTSRFVLCHNFSYSLLRNLVTSYTLSCAFNDCLL